MTKQIINCPLIEIRHQLRTILENRSSLTVEAAIKMSNEFLIHSEQGISCSNLSICT